MYFFAVIFNPGSELVGLCFVFDHFLCAFFMGYLVDIICVCVCVFIKIFCSALENLHLKKCAI